MNGKRTGVAALALALAIPMACGAWPTPPVEEYFGRVALPTNAYWSFASTTQGRIQVVGHSNVNARVETAGPIFSKCATACAADALVGGIYQCTSSVFLTRQKIYLDLSSPVAETIAFFVYESASSNGLYTLIHSNEVKYSAADTDIVSGYDSVTLETGKYYFIGAHWSATNCFFYTNLVAAENFSFGRLIHAYGDDKLSRPPATLTNLFTAPRRVYCQQLTTTRAGLLRMDGDRRTGAITSTNQAVLRLNLKNIAPLHLAFNFREAGNETGLDGVYLSTNGVQYQRIVNLSAGATMTWTRVETDLVAAAASAGMNLSTQTWIKFQQADNNPWPSDGCELENLRVYSRLLPDVALDGLSWSTLSAFRGTNDMLVVSLAPTVVGWGGLSNINSTITNHYELCAGGGTDVVQSADSVILWTMPAGLIFTQTLSDVLVVPAGKRLTNIWYNLFGQINRGFAFPESNLTNNSEISCCKFINHYSGKMHFGDILTAIYITNYFPGLVPPYSMTNHLISGTGIVAGYSFRFENYLVNKDLETLDYSVHPLNTNEVLLAITNQMESQHLEYRYVGGARLSGAGARADIRLRLPAGLGCATNATAMFLQPDLIFGQAALNQVMAPKTVTNSRALFFCEESKPLMYPVAYTVWRPTSGELELMRQGGDPVVYVRKDELQHLESYVGVVANPNMILKKSNERYYYFVKQMPFNPSVTAGSAYHDARVTTQLTFNRGTNVTHFPYGIWIPFRDGGTMDIQQDLVKVGSGSQFSVNLGATMHVRYERDCPAEQCPAVTGSGMVPMLYSVGLMIDLTADGGFHINTTLAPTNILWGSRQDGTYAQQTESFPSGSFYMPGHFMRGGRGHYAINTYYTPAEILLSGLLTNDLATLELNGTTNYLNGLGDYAGLNLRVGADGARQGQSSLGGTLSGWYPLAGRSKYYLRPSGVSGIHEADALDDKFQIYGYNILITNFGLSYLSGANIESRTDGEISLPTPADFEIAFEEMKFTCLGDLDTAEVPDNTGEKVLAYWQSRFVPYSIAFVGDSDAPCGTSGRFLTIPVETACANLPADLFGTFGFSSNGNLITAADGINDIDSRLSVPSTLELAGPAEETYYLTPVCNAYLNNYAAESNKSSGVGFINLAGKVDIPFFEDMKVHLQTSANTNAAGASLYVVGGWPTRGWTDADGQSFFDITTFDAANDGYPTNACADNGAYRSGSDYRPRAYKCWLGVVTFDYPLSWSTTTKSFKSPAAEEVDLLVINIQHQVDYLSADNAELSFGAQYDGLPQVNLADMAFNAVDEQTGIASCFISNGIAAVSDAILDGVDELNSLAGDQAQELMDGVVNQLIDPVVSNLYAKLYTAYTNGPDTDYYSDLVDEYVAGVGASTSDNAAQKLQELTANGTNLISRVDQALARVETLLNGFTATVPEIGPGYTNQIKGLLTFENDEYPVLTGLGQQLVQQLAVAAAEALGAELEPGMKETLNTMATTLEEVRSTMGDLRASVTNLRARLRTGQDFALELARQVDPAVISNATATAASEIKRRMAEWRTNAMPFTAYTPDEVRSMILQQIEDQFYASDVAENLNTALRARVYELSGAVQQACDTVFQQINAAIRNLISEFMAALDEKINGALGSLSDTIGAGQINGYAHINGDSLQELRVDGKFQWKVPDALEFQGYFIIRQLDSDGAEGCSFEGGTANEVILGADDVSLNWLSEGLKADVSTKFTFMTDPAVEIMGMAGAFELTGGTLGFESFKITQLAAAVAFGALENYLSAAVGAQFDSVEVMGGIYFGRTCTLDPINLWDPDVGEVLGEPPFTGIYSYGEGWIPIYDYGCVFNVSAGAGAGIFYFVEGPIGGKIMLGAKGEALCAVTVKGEVRLAGSKNGDDFSMVGKGKISGKAGVCPFCVSFSKQVKFTYKNGTWDADY